MALASVINWYCGKLRNVSSGAKPIRAKLNMLSYGGNHLTPRAHIFRSSTGYEEFTTSSHTSRRDDDLWWFAPLGHHQWRLQTIARGVNV